MDYDGLLKTLNADGLCESDVAVFERRITDLCVIFKGWYISEMLSAGEAYAGWSEKAFMNGFFENTYIIMRKNQSGKGLSSGSRKNKKPCEDDKRWRAAGQRERT